MKKLNKAAAIFAVVAASLAPLQAIADEPQQITHPLTSSGNPSFQEIYAITQFLEGAYLMMNTHGIDMTPDALLDGLLIGNNIAYDEDFLEGRAQQIMREFYGQEDITNMSVVCGDLIPNGAINTVSGALNHMFGRPILSEEQIVTVMNHFMDVPAGFYLGLREAEYQQRLSGLNPEDAFCKQGTPQVADAGVQPQTPVVQ